VPNVLKSGNLDLLEPLGPVQAFNGIALRFVFLDWFGWNLVQEVSTQVVPLGSYELHEDWCAESLALCKDRNEILPIFSTIFLLCRSWCMRCPWKLWENFWVGKMGTVKAVFYWRASVSVLPFHILWFWWNLVFGVELLDFSKVYWYLHRVGHTFSGHELNGIYTYIMRQYDILIVKTCCLSLYTVTKYAIWSLISPNFCVTSQVPIIWWAAVILATPWPPFTGHSYILREKPSVSLICQRAAIWFACVL